MGVLYTHTCIIFHITKLMNLYYFNSNSELKGFYITSIFCMYLCYQTKVEVQLPTLPIAKFLRQSLVRKEGGLYSNAVQSGRMADSCLKAHPIP